MDPLNDRLLDPPHQPLEVESRKVAAMLKAIHAQEDREAARVKVRMVTEKLKELKLGKAAALVEGGAEETSHTTTFPRLTGAVSAQITLLSGSTVNSENGRELSGIFLTASPRVRRKYN